jgi:UDP-N-acetylmuramate-alanine ligase
MHFHFIGICGTAMGSAAVALSRQGHRISERNQPRQP